MSTLFPTLFVARFGFDRAVQAVVSQSGQSAAPNPTYDLTGATGPVGCAVIIPPAPFGLQVTNLFASVDAISSAPGLRVAVVSMAGQPGLLAGILANMTTLIGAKGFSSLSPTLEGAAIPDLATQITNPSLTGMFGSQTTFPSLDVHLDEISDVVPGKLTAVANLHFGMTGRGGIDIGPNRSVAALFIAYRQSDGSIVATAQKNGTTVRGSCHGYNLTQADAAYIAGVQPAAFTPSRFNNVAIPGPLAG